MGSRKTNFWLEIFYQEPISSGNYTQQKCRQISIPSTDRVFWVNLGLDLGLGFNLGLVENNLNLLFRKFHNLNNLTLRFWK